MRNLKNSMKRALVAVSGTALLTLSSGGCIEGLFDGDSGSGGDGGSSGCGDTESLLSGEWITEGDTTSSYSYATLTFYSSSMTGRAYQYAGGYNQTTNFDWRIQGDCDEIHYDYGAGWLDDYSQIFELTSSKLDLQATDGSYYGQRTRYDRLGSGGSGSGSGSGGDDGGPMGSDTCQQPCDPDYGPGCNAGEVCWNTSQGMICISEDCVACFNAGLTCTQNSLTCEFQTCE